jgi:hypothetical protein
MGRPTTWFLVDGGEMAGAGILTAQWWLFWICGFGCFGCGCDELEMGLLVWA